MWYQCFIEGDKPFEVWQRAERNVCGRPDKNKCVSEAVSEDWCSKIWSVWRAGFEPVNCSENSDTTSLHEESECKWMPSTGMGKEMAGRFQSPSDFCSGWEREGDAMLQRIITADKNWVYFYDPVQNAVKPVEAHWFTTPKKVSRNTGKHVVFFDMEKLVICHALLKGQTIENYMKVCILFMFKVLHGHILIVLVKIHVY